MSQIAVQAVSLEVAGRLILDAVSLNGSAGRFTGIIGPNGVGKSTLLRIMAGLLTPTRGEATLSGTPVTRMGARALARHTALDAPSICREAMRIAAELCVYTNDQLIVEEL